MTGAPPSNPRVRRIELLVDAAILTLIWSCVAVLVDPIGEFPLNDDWAGAITVETKADEDDSSAAAAARRFGGS
jgi:hypothetical protein